MASLELDPNASVHELYRAREACSFALRWLLHPDCSLPAPARMERIDDLVDVIGVHDRALEALYAQEDAGPVPRRRDASRRRVRWGARQA